MEVATVNTRLIALCAVAALLGGYVLVEGLGLFTSGKGEKAPVAGSAAQPSAGAKLNPLDGLDPEAFAAIVDRPLFNPTRLPRPPAPVEPPPPPEQPVVQQPPPPPPVPQGPGPEDYKLLGVSAGPDGRIAALRVASSGEVVYLRKGESVDNWSVVDVGDRSVAIGDPQSPVTYAMFDSGADSSAGDGLPAPPPPSPAQPLPLPLPLPMPKTQPQGQIPGQPPLPEQHMIPNTGG